MTEVSQRKICEIHEHKPQGDITSETRLNGTSDGCPVFQTDYQCEAAQSTMATDKTKVPINAPHLILLYRYTPNIVL